ncbi:MAG: hypothetical protein WKF65_10325 [Gaiellaceae bacterium]
MEAGHERLALLDRSRLPGEPAEVVLDPVHREGREDREPERAADLL